jgi:NADH dehydrogenase
MNKKVVIIGGGFGGLATAQALKNAKADITLIDKTNHHLFQPLLYQVAVGALAPADVAVPLRTIFRKQKNIHILLNEVVFVDKNKRIVYLKSKDELPFDYLVIASGTQPTYFNHPEWEAFAPGLKTIRDAMDIREKVLTAYEVADCVEDPNERRQLLTFVVVGAGPTGVELAGSLAEIGRKTLLKDFKNLKHEKLTVYLVDGGDRVLSAFDPFLSERAKEDLEELGVEVMLNTRVSDVGENYVLIGEQKINTANIIWAAGNQATPLMNSLNTELDRMGRAIVNADCSLPNYPNIFVIGDTAHFKSGTDALPGLAPVATQQGNYVAKIIAEDLNPEWRKPFQYFDKGTMATIGRAKAIAQIGKIKLGGFIAWAMWALIHVALLIHFRNRIRVMVEWIWFYITFQPSARIMYWNKAKKDTNRS